VTLLTGTQHEIAAGGYRAVVTELGAGLRELAYHGREVIAGYPPDELPPAAAGQLLVPWPNRVDGGRYTFAGASYQLDLTEPGAGNAIHGLTRWAPWHLAGRDAHRVALRLLLLGQPGYPFCLEIAAEYALGGQGLQVSVTARNVGSRPAPYGTGAHPYLTTGADRLDDCELTLPASQWLPPGPRGIPAGPPQPVAGTRFDFRAARRLAGAQLDHAFTGLAASPDARTWARLASPGSEVALWCGPGYRWLQVFTGDTLVKPRRRRAVAVEPMTCPPNALASGTDLIVLRPGQAVTHSWGITVTPRAAGG
jgi:aldose 1-epimerase